MTKEHRAMRRKYLCIYGECPNQYRLRYVDTRVDLFRLAAKYDGEHVVWITKKEALRLALAEDMRRKNNEQFAYCSDNKIFPACVDIFDDELAMAL